MASHARWILPQFFLSGSPWLARGVLVVLAGAFLAACQSGSSCGGMSSGYQADAIDRPGMLACNSSSSSAPASVDPGDQATLSNALAITSSTTATGTGAMSKFAGPLTNYVTATTGVNQLNMPATATAKGGTTATLTLNPTASGLVPYCDVGASSAYTHWVPSASPGQSVSGSPLTLAITWPAFSSSGIISFRCSGVLNNVSSPSTNSNTETTAVSVTP